MARRYSKSNTGLHVFCVIMTLLMLAVCTLGGLQLWGKGKMKPSEWFKSDELAPVTISFEDATAPIGAAQTLANGARAYALTDLGGTYPSTKRATASCTLPDGEPDTYEWRLSSEAKGVSLSSDTGKTIQVTATASFEGTATLYAYAYKDNILRGSGNVHIRAKPSEVLRNIDIYFIWDTEEQYTPFLEQLGEAISFDSTKLIIQKNYFISVDDILSKYSESGNNDILFLDDDGRIAKAFDTRITELEDENFAFIDTGETQYRSELIQRMDGYILNTEYWNRNTTILEPIVEISFKEWLHNSSSKKGFTDTFYYITDPSEGGFAYQAFYSLLTQEDYIEDSSGEEHEIRFEKYTGERLDTGCFLLSSMNDLEKLKQYGIINPEGYPEGDFFWIIADASNCNQEEYEKLFAYNSPSHSFMLTRIYSTEILGYWATQTNRHPIPDPIYKMVPGR